MPRTTPLPHRDPPRRNSIKSAARARRGSMLVECVVATFLLSVVALTLSANTRAIVTVADDAILVARAQNTAVDQLEERLLTPCDRATLARTPFGARISASYADVRGAALDARTVAVALAPSPLAQRDTQRLVISSARSCP